MRAQAALSEIERALNDGKGLCSARRRRGAGFEMGWRVWGPCASESLREMICLRPETALRRFRLGLFGATFFSPCGTRVYRPTNLCILFILMLTRVYR